MKVNNQYDGSVSNSRDWSDTPSWRRDALGGQGC